MIGLSKTLVVNRLNKAIDRMKWFKDGDYNISLPLEGNDEITRLAESFNEMAGMIRERDREKDELLVRSTALPESGRRPSITSRTLFPSMTGIST